MSTDYDAVIIGGGLGGAIASRELQHRGLRTVLVEARDRLGGRAWTPEVRGVKTDMGGQNVHWAEPFIWSEITRYELAVTPTPTFEIYAVREGDKLLRYTAAEGFGQMVSGLTRFNGGLESVFSQPYQPLLQLERVLEIDGSSVGDRLREIDLDPDQRRWLTPYFGMLSGGNPDSMSFAWMVYLAAWAGGVPEMLRARSAFRVVDGLEMLVRKVVADAGVEVRLGTPVASVLDDGERVVVTTATGEDLAAATCVVATSGNMLSRIDFPAGLSDSKVDVSRRGAQTPNAFCKLFALIEGDVDPIYIQRADYDSHPLIHVRRDLRRPDGLTQVIGFSVDPALNGSDHGRIATLFAETLDIPLDRIVDVVAYDWVADEWSRGGTAFLRPGHYGRLAELLQPEGRLVFAISDMTYGGYNAAVERGMRAANDTLRIHARGPGSRSSTVADQRQMSPALPSASRS